MNIKEFKAKIQDEMHTTIEHENKHPSEENYWRGVRDGLAQATVIAVDMETESKA